jgi:excisionase family DNA binding protein
MIFSDKENMKMAPTAFVFGIQQAAEQLGGISPWTLRKHIAQGHVRVTRIGRRILLGKDELERIHREGLPSLRASSLLGQKAVQS